MMPPFSGVDVVRVMRAEFDDEERERQRRRDHEATVLRDQSDNAGSSGRLAWLRRRLALEFLRPKHPQT